MKSPRNAVKNSEVNQTHSIENQTEYYVSKGEDNLGPWTLQEVIEKIDCAEVSKTDFIYDEKIGDWISIMDCASFADYFQRKASSQKPKSPPPKMKRNLESVSVVPAKQEAAVGSSEQKKSAVLQQDEWFVQKGADRHGPLSFNEVLRGLQEKTIYDFDFVWKEGMESWQRIAEHDSFKKEHIRELLTQVSQTNSEQSEPEVFFKRKYTRVRFDSEVIVHDDKSVWMGRSFEASTGGSGMVIENAALAPGQVIRLHFAPSNGLPAFNALGEIVGKNYQKEIRAAKTPVRYAVRFLKLDGAAESAVREFFAGHDEPLSS